MIIITETGPANCPAQGMQLVLLLHADACTRNHQVSLGGLEAA
jgi:hypothetical protein